MNIIKNIENSSIVVHVQWDAVDDFLPSYMLNWNDGSDQAEAAFVAQQTSYTITGLTLDTVYTITVSAAATCAQGPEFITAISLYTSTIGPTFTANTNPVTIISIVNPSITSTATITTVAGTANYTDPTDITPFDATTAIISPTTTAIVTNPINSAGTTTANDTSKSLIQLTSP